MKKYTAILLFFSLSGIRFAINSPGTAAPPKVSSSDSHARKLSSSGENTLIFPQIANGSGGGVVYRSRVILINNA